MSGEISKTCLLIIENTERLKNTETKDYFIKEFLEETKNSKDIQDNFIRNFLMADTYRRKGYYAAASPFIEKSIKLATIIGVPSWRIEALIQTAENLRRRNHPEKATKYLWQAKRICDSVPSIEGLSMTYRELSLNQLT